MTDADIIEAFLERSAILEFDGLTNRQRIDQPQGLYRQNCDRRAYIQVKRQYGISKMPARTFEWAGKPVKSD